MDAISILPHAETDGMTSADIKEALAEAEGTLKVAKEAHDEYATVWAEQEIRQLSAALARRNGEAPADSGKKRESQADILLRMTIESGAKLFHTATGETYISFPVSNHIENWPINSNATRQWLRRGYFLTTRKAPNNDSLQTVVEMLKSLAQIEGETLAVHLRAGWHDGALYYDLADKDWRSVRIDALGWKIIKEPPIKFRRYTNTLSQDEPSAEGDISTIWNFLNIKNDEDRRLVEAWLVTAFIPDIPRPMLVSYGDQGAAKSTTCKMLLALVDPSATPCLRTKDSGEMVQALAHRFATVLDNVSTLPGWLSDLLCCAITGDGFTKRQLFTDDDDIIYSYQRALLFNGINVAISKPDLLDRCLLIQLERPPNSKRRKEADLWRDFYAVRPVILGGIFDRLSNAIANYKDIRSADLPRMADFAQWAMAATGDVEQFVADYKVNVSRQNSEAVTESVVATVLLDWLQNRTAWSGQPHELHATLKDHLSTVHINEKEFPSTPAALGKKLREIRPNLIALGWNVRFADKERPRKIYIQSRDIADSADGPDGADKVLEANANLWTAKNMSAVACDGDSDCSDGITDSSKTSAESENLNLINANDSTDSTDSKNPHDGKTFRNEDPETKAKDTHDEGGFDWAKGEQSDQSARANGADQDQHPGETVDEFWTRTKAEHAARRANERERTV